MANQLLLPGKKTKRLHTHTHDYFVFLSMHYLFQHSPTVVLSSLAAARRGQARSRRRRYSRALISVLSAGGLVGWCEDYREKCLLTLLLPLLFFSYYYTSTVHTTRIISNIENQKQAIRRLKKEKERESRKQEACVCSSSYIHSCFFSLLKVWE